jgi:hypothetical protein
MTVKEAAGRVLRAAGESLTIEELTRRILAGGHWHTKGETPQATVAARLYADIKKRGGAPPERPRPPDTRSERHHPQGLRPESHEPTEHPPATTTPPQCHPGRKTTERSAPDHLATVPGDPRPSRPQPQPEPQPPSAPGGLGRARPRPQRPPTTLSFFTDAAEQVLDQRGHKKRLHYRAITQRALPRGWLATARLTPEAKLARHRGPDARGHDVRPSPDRDPPAATAWRAAPLRPPRTRLCFVGVPWRTGGTRARVPAGPGPGRGEFGQSFPCPGGLPNNSRSGAGRLAALMPRQVTYPLSCSGGLPNNSRDGAGRPAALMARRVT